MRALVVIVGLLVLLPLDALAGARRGTIAIVDANDRQVGTVVGSGLDQVTIALGVNGRQALLEVVAAASHVFPGGGAYPPIRGPGLLFFESADCSGAPFLYQPPNRLFDWAVVAPPGLTLYFPETAGTVPRTILVGSFLDTFQTCRPSDPPFTYDFVPAAAIADLLAFFAPPFRLVFGD